MDTQDVKEINKNIKQMNSSIQALTTLLMQTSKGRSFSANSSGITHMSGVAQHQGKPVNINNQKAVQQILQNINKHNNSLFTKTFSKIVHTQFGRVATEWAASTKSYISNFSNIATGMLNQAFGRITNELRPLFDMFKTSVNFLWDVVVKPFGKMFMIGFKKIGAVFKSLMPQKKTQTTPYQNNLMNRVTQIHSLLKKQKTGGQGSGIGGLLSGGLGFFSNIFKVIGMLPIIGTLLSLAMPLILGFIGVKLIKGIWGMIKDTEIGEQIQKEILDPIAKFWDDTLKPKIEETFKDIGKWVWEGITGKRDRRDAAKDKGISEEQFEKNETDRISRIVGGGIVGGALLATGAAITATGLGAPVGIPLMIAGGIGIAGGAYLGNKNQTYIENKQFEDPNYDPLNPHGENVSPRNKKIPMSRYNKDGTSNWKTGGWIGPGNVKHDRHPALLADNEYVIKSDTVKKYGVRFFDDLNKGKIGLFNQGGGFNSIAGKSLGNTNNKLASSIKELSKIYFKTFNKKLVVESASRTAEYNSILPGSGRFSKHIPEYYGGQSYAVDINSKQLTELLKIHPDILTELGLHQPYKNLRLPSGRFDFNHLEHVSHKGIKQSIGKRIDSSYASDNTAMQEEKHDNKGLFGLTPEELKGLSHGNDRSSVAALERQRAQDKEYFDKVAKNNEKPQTPVILNTVDNSSVSTGNMGGSTQNISDTIFPMSGLMYRISNTS
jgi:hypothetical protein